MHLVSKISNLCGPDPPTSQTDGRHAISNTALCSTVHGTVIIIGLIACLYSAMESEDTEALGGARLQGSF